MLTYVGEHISVHKGLMSVTYLQACNKFVSKSIGFIPSRKKCLMWLMQIFDWVQGSATCVIHKWIQMSLEERRCILCCAIVIMLCVSAAHPTSETAQPSFAVQAFYRY